MSFLVHKGDGRATFQLAAMVDVVFILLAFFVLASQFRRPESDFSMAYVRSPAAARGAAAEDLPDHIPVRLRRSGAGVAITIGQARLPDNDFAGIQAKLTRIDLPAIGVRVLADPELSVDQVAAALDAVLASPMKNVSISALRTDSGGAGGPENGSKGG